MIIGFLYSTIMMPLTVIMFDFCGVFGGMLGDKTNFLSYDSLLSSSVSDNMVTCLFGSGNIAA